MRLSFTFLSPLTPDWYNFVIYAQGSKKEAAAMSHRELIFSEIRDQLSAPDSLLQYFESRQEFGSGDHLFVR